MMTLWDLLPKRVREKFFAPAAPSPSATRQVPSNVVARAKPPRRRPERGENSSARPVEQRPRLNSCPADPAPIRPKSRPTTKSAQSAGTPAPIQAKYDAIVVAMLAAHGVRVRKWRTSMSGVAWQVTYRDGSVKKLIESPKPKGPMSVAVFLHEIGHHAIGFNVYKPRCLEEYHAWAFSIRQMEAHGLNITDAVRRRMARSLHYAVAKASRRGIKAIPRELAPYVQRPR